MDNKLFSINVAWESGWSTMMGHNPTLAALQRAAREHDRVVSVYLVIHRKVGCWKWICLYRRKKSGAQLLSAVLKSA